MLCAYMPQLILTCVHQRTISDSIHPSSESMDNRTKFKEIMRLKRQARQRGLIAEAGVTPAQQRSSKAEAMLLSVAGHDAEILNSVLVSSCARRVPRRKQPGQDQGKLCDNDDDDDEGLPAFLPLEESAPPLFASSSDEKNSVISKTQTHTSPASTN